MELVEAQEVKKVRYKLWGGTPFAKTDINEVRCARSGQEQREDAVLAPPATKVGELVSAIGVSFLCRVGEAHGSMKHAGSTDRRERYAVAKL